MFKVRAKRTEDGYLLSYGKGGHKLTAKAVRTADGKRWRLGHGTTEYENLRDLKQTWGRQAAARYAGKKFSSTVDHDQRRRTTQSQIDNAPSKREAWSRYAAAQNAEEVCRMAHKRNGEEYEPHRYTPPPGPPPFRTRCIRVIQDPKSVFVHFGPTKRGYDEYG